MRFIVLIMSERMESLKPGAEFIIKLPLGKIQK